MTTENHHNLPLGHIDYCQVCGSKNLELLVDMGHHPPCDSLLSEQQLLEAEQTYPLRLVRCMEPDCELLQIDYVVAPEILFHREYPYLSGITATLAQNLQNTGITISEAYGLGANDLAIDIGSNDGTLLKGFKAKGVRVLGIEPTNIARVANDNGIPTLQSFFTYDMAMQIKDEHGPAKAATAANMFAHVALLGELIQGVQDMLTDDGVFVTESHYLPPIIERLQFDSIYHEHLKYYTLKSLIKLFSFYDFTVVDAERIPNYGGSIRVYAQKGTGRPVSERLKELLQAEDAIGLNNPQIYQSFVQKTVSVKTELQHLLVTLAHQGKSIVGVGCPGRASTLLNYTGIDPLLMPYIAEQSSSLKLGLYLPGKHIPIIDEQKMLDEQPDYALMLSWHYAEPIIKKLREKGLKSKIIMPLPEVQILD